MPRNLADAQGAAKPYTSAQIEAALLAPTGHIGVRFDVLDRFGAITPIQLTQANLPASSPLAGGVLSAVVEFNATKQVRKSLTLKLLPVPALLSVPMRYWIRPWLQVSPMPDGGTAELVMGTYLWMKPQRTITSIGADSNIEVWDIVLGDRQHVLDLQGPGPAGIQLNQGTLTTQAIQTILGLVGITDFSQIQANTATLVDTLSFTLTYGDLTVRVFDPAVQAMRNLAAWNVAVYNNYVQSLGHPELVQPVPNFDNPLVTKLGSSPETLAKILDSLHAGIGYDPGYFDLEDRWVAKTKPNPSTTKPGINYTAAQVPAGTVAPVGSRINLMLGNPQVTPDPSQIANRVTVRSQSTTNSGQPTATADLNTVMPNHPNAQNQIGFYIDATVDEATADASNLAANALSTLLSRALEYETITLDTFAYPTHEGYELVGVTIPGDAEFGSGVTCSEVGWTLDLMSGRMTHSLKRAY